MFYNYRMPYHPFSRAYSEIRYLPISNPKRCHHIRRGETVYLYGRDIRGNYSKIGVCQASGPLVKYCNIPERKKHFCSDDSTWQLPIVQLQARGFFMDKTLMEYCRFPLMEERIRKIKPVRFDRFAQFENLPFIPREIIAMETDDLNDYSIYSKFWYIWKYCSDLEFLKQYRELTAHLYQDQVLKTEWYLPAAAKRCKSCEICGMTYTDKLIANESFFELHSVCTERLQRFTDIACNCQILCPSCHKKLHAEMLSGDILKIIGWNQMESTKFYNLRNHWTQAFAEQFNEFCEKKIYF